MHDSLVDADDFPIQGLDIYQIRQVRQKIICEHSLFLFETLKLIY